MLSLWYDLSLGWTNMRLRVYVLGFWNSEYIHTVDALSMR